MITGRHETLRLQGAVAFRSGLWLDGIEVWSLIEALRGGPKRCRKLTAPKETEAGTAGPAALAANGRLGRPLNRRIFSDICSYVMKRSHPALLEKLAAVPIAGVCMSVVSKAELLYGVRVSPNPARDGEALEGLLTYVEVSDFPDSAATHCAEIRGQLREQGEQIGANDLFIAAHARSLGLTLVTNNLEEFSRVPGLALEDWAS